MLLTRARVLTLAAAVGLLIACGAQQPTTHPADQIGSTPQSAMSGPSKRAFDWDGPWPATVRVASPAEASGYLAFTPREPKGLDNLRAIYVDTMAPDAEREFRAVVFLYDTEPFGLVHLSMKFDDMTAEQRRVDSLEAVARNSDPNTRGRAEVILIRGGTEALLGYPPDETRVSIAWREGPVFIVVAGPTLTRDSAIAIAENL
jgi:hypothetical protein